MHMPQVLSRLEEDLRQGGSTCQDNLARHEDEQHHFGLLHSVDQACRARAGQGQDCARLAGRVCHSDVRQDRHM